MIFSLGIFIIYMTICDPRDSEAYFIFWLRLKYVGNIDELAIHSLTLLSDELIQSNDLHALRLLAKLVLRLGSCKFEYN